MNCFYLQCIHIYLYTGFLVSVNIYKNMQLSNLIVKLSINIIKIVNKYIININKYCRCSVIIDR